MTKKILLAFLILTCCSTLGFAAPSGGATGNSIGAMLGVGWVDTSSNALTWGVELKFALVDKITLGVYTLSYGSSISLQHEAPDYAADVSSSARQYGLSSGYKIGFLPGGEIGMRAAYVRTENSALVSSSGINRVNNIDTGISWGLAPRVAVEFPFGKVSVGSEVDYFFGLGQNAPNGFFFLIPLRYYY